MKPHALLLSCDKKSDFNKTFIDLASDKLQITEDISNIRSVDYIYIFVGNDKQFTKSLSKLSSDKKAVICADQSLKNILESSINFSHVKIVYYANILDSKLSTGYISTLLKELKKGKVSLPNQDVPLNMVTSADLTETMLECSFTFYSPGVHSYYVENGLTLFNFVGMLQQLRSDIDFYSTSKSFSVENFDDSTIRVEPNKSYLNNYLSNIVVSDSSNFSLPSVSIPSFDFSLKKLALRTALVGLSLPVLVFAISAISLYVGYWGINNNRSISDFSFKLAQLTAFHDPIKESAKVGERVLAVSDSTKFDFENATPDQLREYFANVEVSLNSLYKDLSFSDSLITASSTVENRELVLSVHELIALAPILLGLERQTSYAIVFNEDSEFNFVHYAEVEDGRVLFSRSIETNEIDSQVEGQIPAPFDEDEQYSVSDIGWEGDFPQFAQKLRWFMDKSHNLNPETVVRIDLSKKDLIENYLKKGSQLVQLDTLTELLILFKQGSIDAHSNNLKLQAYAESQNIASSMSQDGSTSVYLNEFNPDSTSLIRDVDITAYISDSQITTEVKTKYTSMDSEVVTFYPRNFINGQLVEDEAIELFPGEDYVQTSKVTQAINGDSELGLYVNSLNLGKDTKLNIEIFNDRSGFINTVPHLNLTRDGALGYTTSLEQPILLQIILDK